MLKRAGFKRLIDAFGFYKNYKRLDKSIGFYNSIQRKF
jgi:hypothetical protein